MEFVMIRDLRLKPGEVWDKQRQAAAERGADKLSAAEIEAEITQARRERRANQAEE